jgi:hypothetical protein
MSPIDYGVGRVRNGWGADIASVCTPSILGLVKRLISTAPIVCLVGCATPPTGQLSSVTVIERHSYAICAGYCPRATVVVRPNGRVTLSYDVQVTRKQAAHFIRTLNPYRPAVREAGPPRCEFWNSPDPLVLKVYPYEVIWTDTDGSTFKLHSCGDPGLHEAIRQAFWSIGRYMGGERRP